MKRLFNTPFVPEAGVGQCKPTKLEGHPYCTARDRRGVSLDSDVGSTADTTRRRTKGERHKIQIAGHLGSRISTSPVQRHVDIRFVIAFKNMGFQNLTETIC